MRPDEDDILFQKFFKSVGPRTYAAQVKRARNGNHYLVLTEGKRDNETGDVRKIRLFVYGEDFVEFFRLVKSAAEFIRDNPVPADVKRKRERYWAKQAGGPGPAAGITSPIRPAGRGAAAGSLPDASKPTAARSIPIAAAPTRTAEKSARVASKAAPSPGMSAPTPSPGSAQSGPIGPVQSRRLPPV